MDPGPHPIICFAGQDWWYHSRAHSDFQLMTRLATSRTVLLVNSIGMRMPRPRRGSKFVRKLARKLKSTLKFLRRPLPGVPNYHVFSPLVIPAYGSAIGQRWSAALVRAQVRLAARALGIGDPDVFLTVPTAWSVVRGIGYRKLIYNRSDKHSEFPEADQVHIRSLEHQLLENADHVLYVNQALLDEERVWTGGRGHLLDHGVDVDLFDPARIGVEPPDLTTIGRPRVGFFGSLRPHLVDFDLLVKIARDLPHVQVVLIGDLPASTSTLAGENNIHLLGNKDYADVPSYGHHLDVALMPYRINDWIRYSNPIKLKEYLALGLPVVSTDFPEARRYERAITVAPDPASFIAAIRAALLDDRPEDAAVRRQLVLGETWQSKTEELMRLIDQEPLTAAR